MDLKNFILILCGLISSGSSFSQNKDLGKTPIKDNIQAESINLITLRSGIYNLYSAGNPNIFTDYSTINSNILLTAQLVPFEMRSKNTIKSRFDLVLVNPSQYHDNKYNAFDITYTNVPKLDCIDLVSSITNEFSKITVGDVIIKDNFNGNDINIIELNNACYSKNLNNITFTSI